MRKNLKEARQSAGMESRLTMYNRYSNEEDCKKGVYVIHQQSLAMADAFISLAQLRPQIIEKIL